jgi:uncharacterized protein YneF (UPF0154 family)
MSSEPNASEQQPVEQKLTPPPTNVMWLAIIISVVALLGVGQWMGVFDPLSVELVMSATPDNAPAVPEGKQAIRVAAKLTGKLPVADVYQCAVMLGDGYVLHRAVSRQQIENGETFELLLTKQGQKHTAFIETMGNRKTSEGQVGRVTKRISNLLSFTH